MRLVERLPSWARTVRARLTLIYSALLCGIAAVLLAGLYLTLASTLDAKDLDASNQKFYVSKSGAVKFLDQPAAKDGQLVSAADLDVVQEAANARTLSTLRTYTLVALGALFVISLGVGWWVAGRVLRPVAAITATTREISASDLSRRIRASGPPDELRTLADTIDSMLARLQTEFDTQRALIDDVSHELRNPVAVIRANSDAVFADPNSSAADRQQAAEAVSGAAAGMARLIDDLLALARQRSGAFSETELDLGELARRAVRDYEVLAAEQAITVTVRAETPGPRVFADEQSLTRAVLNLLSNALRFSPEAGEVVVAAGSVSGWAWIAVRDQGPGIPAEDRDRVFDRFYTADRSDGGGGHARSGTGIGLAIARQIVEAHDGRLVVFSEVGSAERTGSTFVIWLPDRTALSAQDRRQVPTTDPVG